MKWKTNPKHSLRTKKYFAFIPIRCEDGYTVWLESYYQYERWDEQYYEWEIVKRVRTLEGSE